MTGPTLQLHHGHVLRALEEIDLVELVAQDLDERARGIERPPTSRFVSDTGGVANTGELVGVEDLGSGEVCVLPASSLRLLRSVARTGLAVRELHPAGVVTAAVFGSSSAVQLHLSVIARMVPNLSHAALYLAGSGTAEIDSALRDELELAGIGVSVSSNQRRAALGANLIVNADLGRYELAIGQLSPGALMVNAAGQDLPDEVLASVDHVYVDDLALLERNRHRNVVKQHQAGRDHRPSQVQGQGEGLHRHQPLWRYERRIEADLAQVLAGVRGRPEVDDVLLVDLLGEANPDITIAGRIHQIAVKHGLGWRINAAEEE